MQLQSTNGLTIDLDEADVDGMFAALKAAAARWRARAYDNKAPHIQAIYCTRAARLTQLAEFIQDPTTMSDTKLMAITGSPPDKPDEMSD